MAYSAKELREKLADLSHKDLIDILVKTYKASEDVRREVNHTLDGENFEAQKLREIEALAKNIAWYSGADCKKILADYCKVCKDRKKRVEAHYIVINAILDGYDAQIVRSQVLMAGSALFGKATEMLSADEELWIKMLDQTDAIVEKFAKRRHELECCAQAMVYYRRARDTWQSER